jgi:hypothetical protein
MIYEENRVYHVLTVSGSYYVKYLNGMLVGAFINNRGETCVQIVTEVIEARPCGVSIIKNHLPFTHANN